MSFPVGFSCTVLKLGIVKFKCCQRVPNAFPCVFPELFPIFTIDKPLKKHFLVYLRTTLFWRKFLNTNCYLSSFCECLLFMKFEPFFLFLNYETLYFSNSKFYILGSSFKSVFVLVLITLRSSMGIVECFFNSRIQDHGRSNMAAARKAQ